MEIFRDQHDELLKNIPDGVSHDTATCIFCNPSGSDEVDLNNNSTEGGDMKTYTEDDFAAALREAVAPLQAELEEVRASQAQEEIEARIAAATAEAEAKIAELQAELDKAELRASEAEKSRDDFVAWLEAEVKAQEEAALVEIRRSERRDAIKEVASFSDDYIESNLDRWVSMQEEDFLAILEDWKTISSKKETASDESGLIPETAMQNTRPTESTSTASSVLSARSRGIDIRTLY